MDRYSEKSTSQNTLQYLEEVVREDPPRQNAFRVLGLSVFDDVHAIRRREQILLMQRFKTPTHFSDGVFPQQERPTTQQIAQAVHRLRSPVCRLMDELFWFWPDEALPSLARYPEQVLRFWVNHEKHPSSWQATHNLGVFYLTKAMDFETQEMTANERLTDKQAAACIACWKQGVRRWLQLREQEEMWRQYGVRIKHFNDPRFPESTITTIRQVLDEILLRGLMTLLIQAARFGRRAQFDRCLQLLTHDGFHDPLRLSIGRKLLSPLANEIQLLTESTEQTVRRSPETGTQCLRELVDKTKFMVILFDAILPEEDMLTCTVCDSLCIALLGFQVKCTEITDDWNDALMSLRLIRTLARSQRVQHRLDQNTAIVQRNLSGSML